MIKINEFLVIEIDTILFTVLHHWYSLDFPWTPPPSLSNFEDFDLWPDIYIQTSIPNRKKNILSSVNSCFNMFQNFVQPNIDSV